MIIEDDSVLAAMIDGIQNLTDFKSTQVKIVPFSFKISSSARRRILRDASFGEVIPSIQNCVPSLSHRISYRVHDNKGTTFSEYRGDHFHIDFYEPNQITDAVSFHLNDVLIYVTKRTLGRLDGKKLVVKTVEVGTPVPKSQMAKLLLAE